MKKTVTISLADTTIEKVDTYAKNMGISRSSAIAVMCETMLTQQKALDGMEKLMQAVNTLKETQNAAQNQNLDVSRDCLLVE